MRASTSMPFTIVPADCMAVAASDIVSLPLRVQAFHKMPLVFLPRPMKSRRPCSVPGVQPVGSPAFEGHACSHDEENDPSSFPSFSALDALGFQLFPVSVG